MGKRNQQRRAEKRRRHDRTASRSAPPRREVPRDDDAFAEELVWTAATTTDPQVRAKVVEWLTDGPPRAGGTRLVDDVIQRCIDRIVRALLQHGWDSPDVARVAERGLDDVAVGVVSRALAGTRVIGTRHFDRRGAIDAATTALGFLAALPPFPDVGRARPTASRAAAEADDDRMLERVRALLAKAESTTFPEEADALTAKAQQLMARHAIDEAMLAASGPRDAVESRKVWLDRPYEAEKARLLAQVAAANRSRTVWIKEIGVVIVIGFGPDLGVVELLFTSLLVQATRAMTTAPRRADGRTRSFRQSFLVGYAGRIGERLREATSVATREAADEHGDALLPVLADRRAAVDEATDAAFPELKSVGRRTLHGEGYLAGRAAADLATLDPGPAVGHRESV